MDGFNVKDWELRELIATGEIVSLDQRQKIDVDLHTNFIYVLQGTIEVYEKNIKTSRSEDYFVKAGTFFPRMLNDENWTISIQVCFQKAQVCILKRSIFVQNHRYHRLLIQNSEKIAELNDVRQATVLAAKMKQVQDYILKIAHEFGHDMGFCYEFPTNQSVIRSATKASRSTVNRAIVDLEEKHLVFRKHRRIYVFKKAV